MDLKAEVLGGDAEVLDIVRDQERAGIENAIDHQVVTRILAGWTVGVSDRHVLATNQQGLKSPERLLALMNPEFATEHVLVLQRQGGRDTRPKRASSTMTAAKKFQAPAKVPGTSLRR